MAVEGGIPQGSDREGIDTLERLQRGRQRFPQLPECRLLGPGKVPTFAKNPVAAHRFPDFRPTPRNPRQAQASPTLRQRIAGAVRSRIIPPDQLALEVRKPDLPDFPHDRARVIANRQISCRLADDAAQPKGQRRHKADGDLDSVARQEDLRRGSPPTQTPRGGFIAPGFGGEHPRKPLRLPLRRRPKEGVALTGEQAAPRHPITGQIAHVDPGPKTGFTPVLVEDA